MDLEKKQMQVVLPSQSLRNDLSLSTINDYLVEFQGNAYVSGRSCSILKLKIFEKYRQLKEKLIIEQTKTNTVLRNMKLNDHWAYNISKSSFTSYSTKSKSFAKNSSVVFSNSLTGAITDSITSDLENYCSTNSQNKLNSAKFYPEKKCKITTNLEKGKGKEITSFDLRHIILKRYSSKFGSTLLKTSSTNLHLSNTARTMCPLKNISCEETVQSEEKYSDKSDSSESDNDTGKHHPNRRLQAERTKDEAKVIIETVKVINDSVSENCEPSKKASEMWSDVLKSPKLWKVEPYTDRFEYCNGRQNQRNIKEKVFDYQEMLAEFVLRDVDMPPREEESLYEKRCRERSHQPHLLKKFYIPPAQMEVFYQMVTNKLTAQECLTQVCAARSWPEPTYSQEHLATSGDGFVFSCHLKSEKFTPSKCAPSPHIAQELAATQCLDWLGLVQRMGDPRLDDFTESTYF